MRFYFHIYLYFFFYWFLNYLNNTSLVYQSFRGLHSEFGVQCSGCIVAAERGVLGFGLGFTVSSLGFRVQGSEFKVWG